MPGQAGSCGSMRLLTIDPPLLDRPSTGISTEIRMASFQAPPLAHECPVIERLRCLVLRPTTPPNGCAKLAKSRSAPPS